MTRPELIDLLEALDITARDWMDNVEAKMWAQGFQPNKDFFIADGASKICIVFKNHPFVVKWATEGYNEAMQEVEVYRRAREFGVEKFFPRTTFLCRVNDIDFVIQEKVTSFNSIAYGERMRFAKISQTASDKTIKKINRCMAKACEGKCFRQIDPTWAKMAIVLYGKRAVKDLCDFIIQERINDLHRGNIGFRNSHDPVILDFSGYRRD